MDSNQAAQAAATRRLDHAVHCQDVREPYVTPLLERLGRWSALTLQQSVPVGMFYRPEL